MSNKQGYIKDYNGNKMLPETTSTLVLDVAKEQALSQTLVNTPDYEALGFAKFSTATAYNTGDKVYKDNGLYRFIADKTAGEWDVAKVEPWSIEQEIEAVDDAIRSLIPAQASEDNKLADKAYVNDKVSTDTATFRGTFNLVTDLELTTEATQGQIATALGTAISGEDKNDYAFVQIPTSDATPTEIARIDRYKYTGLQWSFEYSLNNSGFTAEQWAAINSGITSSLVTAFGAKYDKPAGGIPASDMNTSTFDDEPTAGSENIVKSGGVYKKVSQLSKEKDNRDNEIVKVLAQSGVFDFPALQGNTIDGKYISTNGALVSTPGFVTKIYTVSEGYYCIRGNNIFPSNANYVFSNSSDLSSVEEIVTSIAGSYSANSVELIKIPNGIQYLGVSFAPSYNQRDLVDVNSIYGFNSANELATIPNISTFKNLCGAECMDMSMYKVILTTDGTIPPNETGGALTYHIRVSYPIPIDASKGNIVWSGGAGSFGSSIGYRFLDSFGNIISFGKMLDNNSDTYKSVEIPNSACFLQISMAFADTADLTQLQVEYGTLPTTFEKFNGWGLPFLYYRDKLFHNQIVTNLAKHPIATSICGVECINYQVGSSILFTNGTEYLENTYPGYHTSYLIPVDKKKGDYITWSGSTFMPETGYRFFDNECKVVAFGRMTGSSTQAVESCSVAVPDRALFLQVTVRESGLRDTFKIEYGQSATEYPLPYCGIKYNGNEEDNPVLVHEISIAKGKEKVLYYDGMDKLSIYADRGRYMCAYGKNYDKFLIFGANSPSADVPEGSYNINIVYTNKLLRRKNYTSKLNVFNPALRSGQSANILVVGDSFTDMGVYNVGLQLLALNDNITLHPIGIMTGEYVDPQYPNVRARAEFQAGGTLYGSFMVPRTTSGQRAPKSYKITVTGVQTECPTLNASMTKYQDANGNAWDVSGMILDANGDGYMRLQFNTIGIDAQLPASGTLHKIVASGAGIGDDVIQYTAAEVVDRNPFWNVNTGEIDFSWYIETWGLATPDILLLEFRGNDLAPWGVNGSASQYTIEQFCENVKTFISKFLAEYPNAKVIYSVQPYFAKEGNWDVDGEKYTCCRVYEILSTYYFNSTNVVIVPSYMFVDDVNGYETHDVNLVSRYPDLMYSIPTDDVHCSDGGMLQESDGLYPYVLKFIPTN